MSSTFSGAGSFLRFDNDDLRRQIRDLERALERLDRDDVPKAITRAQNRTAATTRTMVSRDLRRKVLGLKVKDLTRILRVYRASRARNYASIWAGLKRAKLPKIRTPRALDAGEEEFLATMPSGHRGVFVRSRSNSRRYRVRGPRYRLDGQSTELPIYERFTDYSDQVEDSMRDAFQIYIRPRYIDVLQAELQNRLKRAELRRSPRRR